MLWPARDECCDHRHCFRGSSDIFKLDVDRGGIVDQQLNVLDFYGFESGLCGRNLPRSRLDLRQGIRPDIVGDGFTLGSGLGIDDGDVVPGITPLRDR